MPIEDRNLEPGTRLLGSYKKQTYVCRVEAGEEEGEVVFVLEDGQRFKSLSSAASDIMGGKAVNGWRFWTVEGQETPQSPEPRTKTTRPKKTIFKTPNQSGLEEGRSRWFCSACMNGFVIEGGEEPEQCPQGHKNDNADQEPK